MCFVFNMTLKTKHIFSISSDRWTVIWNPPLMRLTIIPIVSVVSPGLGPRPPALSPSPLSLFDVLFGAEVSHIPAAWLHGGNKLKGKRTRGIWLCPWDVMTVLNLAEARLILDGEQLPSRRRVFSDSRSESAHCAERCRNIEDRIGNCANINGRL